MASFFVTIAKIIRLVDAGATVASKAKPYAQKAYESRGSWKKARDKVKLATKFSRFIYNRGYHKGRRRGTSEARQQERLVIAKRLGKMGFDDKTICRATKINRKEL